MTAYKLPPIMRPVATVQPPETPKPQKALKRNLPDAVKPGGRGHRKYDVKTQKASRVVRTAGKVR